MAAGGLLLMLMGVSLAFLRPPVLPEDLQYMGTSQAEVEAAVPGLLIWLSHVFGVLGGYMFATGLLTAYVAATAPMRLPWAAALLLRPIGNRGSTTS